MTDRGITDLLMNLLALQDSVSVFVRSDRYNNRDVTVARAARDKIRDAILDEFATLRQQRDELAEACRYFVDGWRVVPTDKLDIAYRLAEAALTSIEEAE